MSRYDILVADPPWVFTSNSQDKPGRNARRHYDTMKPGDIAALEPWSWANKDALLFLWVTSPHLQIGMDLMQRVGFTYKSSLVWVKRRPGTGFWVRNRHELVLIGRRGKFPCPKPAPFGDSVLEGQQREHSRKPDSLQDRIDEVWPGARKLEMFARQHRPGWASWGNQTNVFHTDYIHVVPQSGRWAVRWAGAARADRVLNTEDEAINNGRRLAQAARGTLFISGKDGRIRARETYENG